MPNIRHPPRLNQRVAEEAQLLAEEKWIIEALKKIKAQRNSLQIERLHLESMRAKINTSSNTEHANEGTTGQPTNIETEIEVSTSVMQPNTFLADNINVNHSPLDADVISNTEELNLSVTNSVFNRDPYCSPCDEEEDEEDMENCLIDMEMLMSGNENNLTQEL